MPSIAHPWLEVVCSSSPKTRVADGYALALEVVHQATGLEAWDSGVLLARAEVPDQQPDAETRGRGEHAYGPAGTC